MPHESDAYWDELGIAWRAQPPVGDLAASRFGAGLRLQAGLLKAGAALALAAGLLGLGLGAWTLWIGWSGHAWNFVIRAATIALASAVLLAAGAALGSGVRGERRSVRERLELAIARAERLARAAGLGCVALAILALGGLAGYAVRVRLARPPRMSPVEDLLAVAVLAILLLWARAGQSRALRKYRCLAAALFDDEP